MEAEAEVEASLNRPQDLDLNPFTQGKEIREEEEREKEKGRVAPYVTFDSPMKFDRNQSPIHIRFILSQS